mmetsp:Transcript_4088/g.9989  ORF Transcript_4088/g.9989 Transcript_4088/m.9989 type:complete len:183 (+) Transcript_4088:79-627(+)|eukprot:CAMPEP_0179000704 /NCGR_PEP_ID=MMETSP0795-20121207/10850_1 /TAXON_ID=88552 /ORGANISM="Amoebophrya sp., Strain Ameob2" /LENGTH=182 /DNA_ID=CAMNT_0020693791 /DNA_START=49 /DNA_END=597 /DNA_ORIENTATION=+
MAMWDSYQESYREALSEIQTGLENLDTDGTPPPNAVSSLHRLFKDAEDSLRSLDLEARSMGLDKRKEVQGWRAELKSFSKEFDQKLAVINRKGLLGEAAQQKAIQKRLAETDAKIAEGTDMVRAATRTAIESEQIGNEILTDLSQQRETIQRTRANMSTVSGELHTAGKTIKEIEKPNCSLM